MSKKRILLNSGIFVSIIAIILLIFFKFIIKDNNNSIKINTKKVIVNDLNNYEIKFSDLISNNTTYCLFFDMNDCHSCILKGLNDLIELKKSGLNPLAFAIHHRIDEVSGWSKNSEFSPFFMIDKTVFYQNFHIQSTPVIIKINRGKIENFRYIYP